jgi:hypothetical protein
MSAGKGAVDGARHRSGLEYRQQGGIVLSGRTLRITAFVVALLLTGVIAAAWLVPPMLDWNRYRADIIALVSADLGHPVTVDGPISLQLLPEPILTAGKVAVADAQDGVNISVAELRVRLALAPLLSGHVDARELVLRGLDIRLPWPVGLGQALGRPPSWLSSISARIEDGKLAIGPATATAIDATLGLTPDTGTYALAGTAVISNLPWHLSARLTRTGGDGSAGLDLALDGQGPVQGLGAMFSGQIAPSGDVAGRISGSGPDLSRLLAAPAVAFKANGTVSLADNVAVADGLSVDLAGSPARGAVTLRLEPQPRLDVSLAASRLDLDAWLPALLNAAPGQRITAIDTGIDLSAEAATLAGGTLRGLRGGFEITPSLVTLRDVSAILPGDAKLGLVGALQRGSAAGAPQFTGRASLSAPNLRTTLSWLDGTGQPHLTALPGAVLHRADLTAAITLDGRTGSVAPARISLTELAGLIDDSHVQGALSLRPGPRLAVSGVLKLDRLSLDPWLADAQAGWTGLPAKLGPFDLDMQVQANEANLHGRTLAPATVDAAVEAGKLTLRRLDVQNEGARLLLSGSITDAGRIADGKLDLASTADSAGRLITAWLPDMAAFAAHVPHGALAFSMAAAGPPEALAIRATLDISDLHVEAQPLLDLPGQRWTSKLSLRHPGAPRLLDSIGLGGTASWLGDGSLSLAGNMTGAGPLLAPAKIASDGFDVAAGSLHAKGSLTFDHDADHGGIGRLTGRLTAETLPLPLPYLRAPEPLPTEFLSGWEAAVHVDAGNVLAGQSPFLQKTGALVSVADGTLRIDELAAQLEGGILTGTVAFKTASSPPALALDLTLAGAKPTAPVFETPLDLTGGEIGLRAKLNAEGYSPAALLATLTGSVQLKATHGTLAGLDLAQTGPRLEERDLQAAFSGGSTKFDQFDLSAELTHGLVRITAGHMMSPAGTADLSGLIDLPGQSGEFRLAAQPAVADPPTLALRLSGPLASPARVEELSDAVRWRAEHPVEAAQ